MTEWVNTCKRQKGQLSFEIWLWRHVSGIGVSNLSDDTAAFVVRTAYHDKAGTRIFWNVSVRPPGYKTQKSPSSCVFRKSPFFFISSSFSSFLFDIFTNLFFLISSFNFVLILGFSF